MSDAMAVSTFLRSAPLVVAVTWPLAGCAGPPAAPAGQPLVHVEGLGSLSFPNSGTAEAQAPFLRGVLLLHSFEFEPAAEAFREAQAADAGFALAYWGEAMTYNHPLWRQQDRDAALAALARLGATPDERAARAPTDREKAYLATVETLYGDGTKQERDQAYMRAMADLAYRFPDDMEARAFYALAILGSRDGTRDFATYRRAAAVAQPLFDANPETLIRGASANPLVLDFQFPVARTLSGVAMHTTEMNLTLRVTATPADGAAAVRAGDDRRAARGEDVDAFVRAAAAVAWIAERAAYR